MNTSPCRTENYLIGVPVEIKQMIAGYLTISSLINFKLCSKDFNYNYRLSKQQLHELYISKKIFNNVTAFKCYIRFNEPVNMDFENAIWEDKPDIIRVLLKDGRLDPSVGDNYAIRCASQDGYTEIVQMLLEDKRVDASDDDNYAIRIAS
ncbi:hypothetical protein BC833DRAFT_625214, partial [Globomyces pollinis-pini]